MKKIVILTFTIILLLVCLAIGACSKSPAPQPQPQPQPQATNKIPDLSGVIFNGVTYQYDGTPKSLYVTGLPAGIVAQYNGNDVSDAGVHLVTAKLYYDGKLVKNLSAELVIKKAVYDMKGVSFPHVTHAYTGASDNPSIVGKLPGGVTVTYQCDREIKNAGTYNVTAIFTGNRNFEDIPPMHSVYTITKADYDMSGINFPDATVAYTGTPVTPQIIGNLPEGVNVIFHTSPADMVDEGVYTVTASFSGDYSNYNSIPDMTATYTIEKSSYDMSGVSLPSVTVSYTGKEITPRIMGNLPEGVTCTITSYPAVIMNVGSYTVTAKFTSTNPNYKDIPDMTATYTVKKAVYDMKGVTLPSLTLEYTGAEITPYIVGSLPEGVSCTITSEPGVIKDIGTYTVTAYFTGSAQYEDIPCITATYVITPPAYIDGSITFAPMDNGTYEVIGYVGDAKAVVIPNTYNGGAVTSVRSSAFINNTEITYVYIPSTVTNIGNKAFKGCTSLNVAVIGDGVKVIGAEAFANTALKEIVLPDSLESIGQGALSGTPLCSITLPFVGGSRLTSNAFIGYLFGALTYSGNTEKVPATLTSVTLSDAATEIPAYSFYGVRSLKTVTVGNGVTRIGNSAFSGCSSLYDLYIPATVTDIPANAAAYNSPFYNCHSDLMIVLESMTGAGYGQHWSNVSDSEKALTVYFKSYEDYLMNKDSYRDFDTSCADLSFIAINGVPLSNFDSGTLSYSVSCDINKGYPKITAVGLSPVSHIVISVPTAANNGVATITVTSADGTAVKTYTVFVELTGTFTDLSAEVVGKDGTTGAVTFVVDDGDHATAEFTTEMMDKYSSLKFTYAILTNRLATLTTSYDSSTGKYSYVMSNGKYTYTVNNSEVNFWKNILSKYDTEVISHSHSHAFWGIDDRGGVQSYVDSSGNVKVSANLPYGSSTAEIYASKQLIEELLGIRAITHTIPGIGVKTVNTTVSGTTYPTYYTYYKSLLDAAIGNGTLVNLIGNVMGVSQSALNNYVTTSNVKSPNGVARLMVSATDDKTMWTKFIDSAAENNGWATFCIHKIAPTATSGHYILESDAEVLFKHAAEKNVWVANYTEAALYYAEWASADVDVEYTDGKITVTLTDANDNSVYDEALTVKVTVPPSWSVVNVNGETVEVLSDEDGSFVYLNIVPDSGSVIISPVI